MTTRDAHRGGVRGGSDENDSETRLIVTNTLVVRDVPRSVALYRDVPGGTVLRENRHSCEWEISGSSTMSEAARPMTNPRCSPRLRAIRNVLSYFLNLRVADIKRCYDLWSSRGAQFITEPKVHATEMRCYARSGCISDRSWANYGDAGAPRLVRVRRAGLGEPDTRDVLTSWLQTKLRGIESPST